MVVLFSLKHVVVFSAWPVSWSTRHAQWDASGPPALWKVQLLQLLLNLNTLSMSYMKNLSQSFTTVNFPACSGKMSLLWQQMWPEMDLI